MLHVRSEEQPLCHLLREQQGLQLMGKVSLCFRSSHVRRGAFAPGERGSLTFSAPRAAP